MRNKFPFKIVIMIIILPLIVGWIDPFRDEVSKGNSNYKSGNFSGAMKNYSAAEKHAPDSKSKSMLEFNRGNVEFRQQNYESALGKYRNSLNSGDRDVQKKAFYNEGTTYMKMGKKREAAESFIRALQIDPGYEKAKRNLEYLLKKNEQDKKDKKDQNKGQGKGDKGEQKNSGSDDEKNKQGNKSGKKDSASVKKMLESMKNKPVRRRKGKGDGERYLEKYW
ncbi:MAG TPA: tetratricopeptide repeat protein [Spirochaetota bacterium]|nr:tetratricopeptide repeat protein [Spirochaetota bacterium]HPJ35398.1 tetratricopeptide repeat protein [Spirochaetota bacterium]